MTQSLLSGFASVLWCDSVHASEPVRLLVPLSSGKLPSPDDEFLADIRLCFITLPVRRYWGLQNLSEVERGRLERGLIRFRNDACINDALKPLRLLRRQKVAACALWWSAARVLELIVAVEQRPRYNPPHTVYKVLGVPLTRAGSDGALWEGPLQDLIAAMRAPLDGELSFPPSQEYRLFSSP